MKNHNNKRLLQRIRCPCVPQLEQKKYVKPTFCSMKWPLDVFRVFPFLFLCVWILGVPHGEGYMCKNNLREMNSSFINKYIFVKLIDKEK